MAIAVRMAQATWEGPLASGAGAGRTGSGAAGELADEASELCPVSRRFAGAKVTVEATLEPAS
jgi:hypothetical protein